MKIKSSARGRPQNPEHCKRQNERILLAATKIFSSKGYVETEMQRIADQAGIAKGTLYLYFKSKKDLFFAVLDRLMILLRQKLHRDLLNVSDPIQRFKINTAGVLTFCDEHPEFVDLLIQERAFFKNGEQSLFLKHVQEEMQIQCENHDKLIKDGRIRNISKDAVFTVYSDLIYGAIMNKVSAGVRYCKFIDKSNYIVDLCLNGLLTEKERNPGLLNVS